MNFIRKFLVPVVLIYPIIMGLLWLFLDPLGLPAGWPLLISLIFVATLVSAIYVLAKIIFEVYQELESKTRELDRLIYQVNNSSKSTCCVVKQDLDRCPLGIVAIHKEMQETITTSIREATRSFKWMGLSGFNVLHNNRDLFANKKDVKFEFIIANPHNRKLTLENDDFYDDSKGRLDSKTLVSQSNELLNSVQQNFNKNVTVKYHNQLPTFRIIIVDEKKAYVSFYEKAKDALNTVQIEVSGDTEYNILNWFMFFYEKTLITEKIIAPIENNND